MEKWEYRFEKVSVGGEKSLRESESKANQLGEQGWELGGVVTERWEPAGSINADYTHVILLYKRRKP
jgi:hypothetical protein